MSMDDTDIRSLIREVARLQAQVESLQAEVHGLREQQRDIMGQMNRWRGAVPVFLFIGGVIGTVVTSWTKITDFFAR